MMNLIFPSNIPEDTLNTVLKDLLYLHCDFSIRVVHPHLPEAKTIKAVYMESPKDTWFVLSGPSSIPPTPVASFETPLVSGGDRFNCCNSRNDVNKMMNYLLSPDAE
jgi:hypothetical protein